MLKLTEDTDPIIINKYHKIKQKLFELAKKKNYDQAYKYISFLCKKYPTNNILKEYKYDFYIEILDDIDLHQDNQKEHVRLIKYTENELDDVKKYCKHVYEMSILMVEIIGDDYYGLKELFHINDTMFINEERIHHVTYEEYLELYDEYDLKNGFYEDYDIENPKKIKIEGNSINCHHLRDLIKFYDSNGYEKHGSYHPDWNN